MFQSNPIASWVVALGLAVIVGGCTSQTSQEKQKAAEKNARKTPSAPDDHASHEGHEHAGAVPAGVPDGLAELSADDRAAAEKQRVCPVSGEVLGTMGKPYKVSIEEQTVFLCCPACEKELRDNSEKYLAKLQTGKPE